MRKWCPSLRVLKMHVSGSEVERQRLCTQLQADVDAFDVVLTTYEMLLTDTCGSVLRSR